MEISNIASHQVNFKSQTKTQTSPLEVVKEKFNDMEDSEKITVGLSALGALALATLAIVKGKHKKVEIPPIDIKPIDISFEQPSSKGVKIIEDLVQEASEKIYPKIDIAHQPKIEKQQETIAQGVERAIEATKEYVQGGNYSEVRANATRNLSHDGKKVVQGTLEQIHSAKVAQDISNEHKLADMVSNVTSDANATKNTRQGMQNATTSEVAEKLNEAYNSAYEAQIKAQEANKKAQEIGTKKAKKSAKVAKNQADRATVEFEKTEQKAIERQRELAQAQAQKEANIAQQMTSPNYTEGLEKQAQNASQTTINSAKRQTSNLKSKPQYQRTLQEFQRKRYSGDKLLKIMDNPNSSEIEKLAAQELLETITK